MTSFINAADAVAAAIEIKRRSQALYRGVHDKSDRPKDQAFFASMADEEKNHETVFLDMLKRTGGLRQRAEGDQEEYQDYLTAMFYQHTLFSPDLEDRADNSPLRTTMQCEKDSLLFFIEMEAMLPEAEKQSLRACAADARRHIALLGKIRHLR